MKSKNISAAFLLPAVICGFAVKAFACGPDFPNNLLDAGDHAVLQAPVASFQRELQRMQLVKATTRAIMPAAGQRLSEQSTEMEMNDLAAALKQRKISSEQSVVIMQAHLDARMKLNQFLAAQNEWTRMHYWATNEHNSESSFYTNSPPPFPEINVTPGLPREFADYFAGALEWHQGSKHQARKCWERVLALPPEERHFKSTWAEFMLGKSCEDPSGDWWDSEARKHFAQVRALAASGFADSSGLAAASLGEEARVALWRTNYAGAIALYLEQFAAGDGTAVESLRFTAACVFADTNHGPALMKNLALDPLARRVLGVYLISREPGYDCAENYSEARLSSNTAAAWLGAIEAAGVKEVESASQHALATYQAGDMENAQRWIKRAGREPVAQWLQAKLLMRAGNISSAAELLAALCRKFPQDFSATNRSANFADNLSVSIRSYEPSLIAIGRQAWGELGVLRLARREYVEALDALLRSGYWMDAAYVAERVLTTDELKAYVDRHWLATGPKHELTFPDQYDWRRGDTSPRRQIRYLLARRLAREARFAEARNYFPEEWKLQLDALAGALKTGRDVSMRYRTRADALMTAAFITRTNGMELLGTELQPDWFIEAGNFQQGVTWEYREAGRTNDGINVASQDEIERAQAHHAEPEERWHYRDRAQRLKIEAAELLWTAAELLPDNSDELARCLLRGGTILARYDTGAADKYYKALVRRCGRTLIGQQADKIRWFPELDDNGNLKQVIPWIDQVALTPGLTNSVVTNNAGQVSYRYPVPGGYYVVQAGDSIARIARAASRLGPPVPITEILEANPGLNPLRLQIGQMLVIPKVRTRSANSN